MPPYEATVAVILNFNSAGPTILVVNTYFLQLELVTTDFPTSIVLLGCTMCTSIQHYYYCIRIYLDELRRWGHKLSTVHTYVWSIFTVSPSKFV